MRLPESPTPLSRALAVSCLAGALLVPGLILTAGSCSSEPRPLPTPDCSAQEGVEFSPIAILDLAANWYSAGDRTGSDVPEPDAGQTQICVDGVFQQVGDAGVEPEAPQSLPGQIARTTIR